MCLTSRHFLPLLSALRPLYQKPLRQMTEKQLFFQNVYLDLKSIEEKMHLGIL